jgi:hypothetical protein
VSSDISAFEQRNPMIFTARPFNRISSPFTETRFSPANAAPGSKSASTTAAQLTDRNPSTTFAQVLIIHFNLPPAAAPRAAPALRAPKKNKKILRVSNSKTAFPKNPLRRPL